MLYTKIKHRQSDFYFFDSARLRGFNWSLVKTTVLLWMVGLFISAALLISNVVNAHSIESLDSQQLVDRSELIFEGTVLSVEARRHSSQLIVTEVHFAIQDVLSGDYDDKQLVLTFVGGAIAGNRMNIGHMIYPRVGEKGVYFVESTVKPLVNPLVGWEQGHFVYELDSQATERVCTAQRNPIVSIDYGSIPLAASHNRSIPMPHRENGYARGIQLAETAQEATNAVTREQFRAQLKKFIKERQHFKRLQGVKKSNNNKKFGKGHAN